MGTISPQQITAAEEFSQTTIEVLANERGVHAETAIAGTARMAGTFLFRSFNFPLDDATPGQPVLSEQANEQGPRLMNILSGVLEQMEIRLDGGRAAGPISAENEPLLDFLQTQKRLEPKYSEIKDRFGFSYEVAADAVSVATAILIQQTSEVLDPHIAFGIAIYGFIEGTKTVPESIVS
jgi:hypothetical protein